MADRRLQYSPAPGAGRLPQTLGHRMHVRRRQDPASLNIEDTRLTNPRKLALLMALVALAIAWAGRTAADLLGRRSPKRKSHGHLAQSWSRTGFDRLRNLLSAGHEDAFNAWQRLGNSGRKRAHSERRVV